MEPLLTSVLKFTDCLTFMDLAVPGYINRDDFAIIRLDELCMQSPYQTPVFRPDYFSIIVIPEGRATYTVGNEVFALQSGQILFTRPHTFISGKWHSVGKAYQISFTKQFLLQYWPMDIDEIQKLDNAKNYATGNVNGSMNNFENICLDIYDEAVSNAPYKHEVITNLIINLLLLIRQQQYRQDPVSCTKKHNGYASAFLQAIEDNFSSIAAGETTIVFRVNDYADSQKLNANYLSKLVAAGTGKTVNQWIDEKLIGEIKYLLKYTNKPMREIAEQYGFTDLNYFYSYFKRQTQNAPGLFRKGFNFTQNNLANTNTLAHT
ncbi:AraC family transcriptional regulator [Flavobacterium zepuense]|uniref:AraC family transcriptional regulator n=1 Tax=Flavobacterium zepuense TaxID=2593302 RepID=A0A552V9W8_9FLAO|nr:AraC family transcriptional regulator [Flavobacterium zepuense]TRW27261.1 AraC family transcriptional regulator [Flavobacterium zepuense]